MNKTSQKSTDMSSGFDELDDDLFDVDAPIKPSVEHEDQVYSSQLSFPVTFRKDLGQNLSFVSRDDDSGLNSSPSMIEPVSPVINPVFGAESLSSSFYTPNASQSTIGENAEHDGTPNTTGWEGERTDSSTEFEFMDSEEIAPNSDEGSEEFPFVSSIPQSILKLHRGIREYEKCTDYAFAYAIAGQMCLRTFPYDCFHSAKLALTLSIISTHCRDMAPIPIIAIGKDGITMSTLMNEFRVYAQRFLTPFGDLKIAQSHRSGQYVEANSLLMATNGVCFIGDWSSHNASSSAYVKNVLESQRIVVDAQSNIGFPLKCAIWSYWFCSGKKKATENVMMFSNVFGIPAVFEENVADSLLDKMLAASATRYKSADDDSSWLNIDVEDMRNYFYAIGRRPVRFSDEAELLMKEYFLSSRLNRCTLLSQHALRVLRQMSACHAKLCMRDYVHRNDVVACIVLCEKFIFQIYGIEKSNAPSLGPIQHISEVDLYMQSFEKWINSNLVAFGRRAGID